MADRELDIIMAIYVFKNEIKSKQFLRNLNDQKLNDRWKKSFITFLISEVLKLPPFTNDQSMLPR